MNTGW